MCIRDSRDIFHRITTVMTRQIISVFVVCKGNIAVFAFYDIAAVTAGNEGRKASSVQKQNRLLLAFQILGDFLFQFFAQNRTVAVHQFLSLIHI